MNLLWRKRIYLSSKATFVNAYLCVSPCILQCMGVGHAAYGAHLGWHGSAAQGTILHITGNFQMPLDLTACLWNAGGKYRIQRKPRGDGRTWRGKRTEEVGRCCPLSPCPACVNAVQKRLKQYSSRLPLVPSPPALKDRLQVQVPGWAGL